MNKNTLVQQLRQVKYSLVLTSNGVAVRINRGLVMSSNHKRAKRGKVEGFSKASARRLKYLLQHLECKDARAVSVTLTRPHSEKAELIGIRSSEDAFADISRLIGRYDYIKALLWRKEVTRNGEVHYHCVLFPADSFDAEEAAALLVEEWISQLMHGVKRSVAEFASEAPSEAEAKAFNDWLEAEAEAWREKMRKAHLSPKKPCYSLLGDNTGILFYIFDHQSKHKSIQARTTGRVWGVINRKNLPLSEEEIIRMPTEDEVNKIKRVLGKHNRYSLKADCVFGYKHSRAKRGFSNGTTVYFGRYCSGTLSEDVVRYLDLIRS